MNIFRKLAGAVGRANTVDAAPSSRSREMDETTYCLVSEKGEYSIAQNHEGQLTKICFSEYRRDQARHVTKDMSGNYSLETELNINGDTRFLSGDTWQYHVSCEKTGPGIVELVCGGSITMDKEYPIIRSAVYMDAKKKPILNFLFEESGFLITVSTKRETAAVIQRDMSYRNYDDGGWRFTVKILDEYKNRLPHMLHVYVMYKSFYAMLTSSGGS